MLSDDQWKEFKQMMAAFQGQLDITQRLTKIETIVTLSHESFQNYRAAMSADIARIESAASKAHKRIDDQEKRQVQLMSAALAICGFVGFIAFILKLTGKM